MKIEELAKLIERFGIGAVSAIAIVWLVYHVVTVAIPKMVAAHTEEVGKLAVAHGEAVQRLTEAFGRATAATEARWDRVESQRSQEIANIQRHLDTLTAAVSKLIEKLDRNSD